MHERILIVDDQQSIQTLLGRICERAGYAVRMAGDGQTALDMLEEAPIDVGIFDLVLPDPKLGGIEVLRKAKELYPRCEVIIVTGHARLESAIEAMRLGAYDYLEKPLPSVHMITMTIERALERQRLSSHNESLIEELREANQELERRRQQQLRYINNLGQALVGSLQANEMAEVLIRAMLNTLHVDAAGILLLAQQAEDTPLAVVGAQASPDDDTCQALLKPLLAQIPEIERPEADTVELRKLCNTNDGEPTAPPWQSQRVAPLIINENLTGAVVIASQAEDALDEETLGIFDILVNQVSIALQNAYLFGRMRELATRDSMTKLYNHGHFFELLEAEISRSERHGQELAVIMLDLDRAQGLKYVNDRYGHQTGDRLVVALAEALASNVRRADVIARYGGDEFIILAPQTGKNQAVVLAERLASSIKATEFRVAPNETVNCTFSMGVAVYHPGTNESASSVVTQADQACYQAKDLGGDQICVAPASESGRSD